MLPKEQKSGCDHVVRTARRLPQANAPATNARFCPRLRMRGGIREHTEKRTDGLFSEKNGAFQAQFYPDRLVLIPTKRSAEQGERFCGNSQKRSFQSSEAFAERLCRNLRTRSGRFTGLPACPHFAPFPPLRFDFL